MLANMTEILKYAEEKNCAVGSFNTPTLECIQAVIAAAEELNVPVIIMHAQVHESIAPLDKIGPVMVLCAKLAKVPVCVHLDHGEDLDYLRRALDLGFTAVMYDGSLQPYDVNVENTRRAVEMAHKLGAQVEAEIGVLGGRESGSNAPSGKDAYTDPILAERFVRDTGIDALAASFGTAHGFYKVAPKLDFPRIEKIKSLVSLPLVMHGGSGVSPEDYVTAIEKGIRKINYYSYMSRAGLNAARQVADEGKTGFYHDLAFAATEAMKQDALRAMRVVYRL